jgi:hypothetical protein
MNPILELLLLETRRRYGAQQHLLSPVTGHCYEVSAIAATVAEEFGLEAEVVVVQTTSRDGRRGVPSRAVLVRTG